MDFSFAWTLAVSGAGRKETVDISIPTSVHGVPSKVVARDQGHESSALVFLVLDAKL